MSLNKRFWKLTWQDIKNEAQFENLSILLLHRSTIGTIVVVCFVILIFQSLIFSSLEKTETLATDQQCELVTALGQEDGKDSVHFVCPSYSEDKHFYIGEGEYERLIAKIVLDISKSGSYTPVCDIRRGKIYGVVSLDCDFHEISESLR